MRSFLSRTPFFGAISEAALDHLIDLMNVQAVPEGAYVFTEGDTGSSMFVVEEGDLVATRRGRSGNEVRLVHYGIGDFFGETTLIEMQPRPVSVKAVTNARLFELTNQHLYQLYHHDVKTYVMILQNINRELCRRLRKSEGRIIQLADDANQETTQITQANPLSIRK